MSAPIDNVSQWRVYTYVYGHEQAGAPETQSMGLLTILSPMVCTHSKIQLQTTSHKQNKNKTKKPDLHDRLWKKLNYPVNINYLNKAVKC